MGVIPDVFEFDPITPAGVIELGFNYSRLSVIELPEGRLDTAGRLGDPNHRTFDDLEAAKKALRDYIAEQYLRAANKATGFTPEKPT